VGEEYKREKRVLDLIEYKRKREKENERAIQEILTFDPRLHETAVLTN
jgi:hypothetical protein